MRVVSWNIHWGCGKDSRIRIHAIIDVLRKLNPDIICLQEVAANHPELEGNASANQFRQLAGAFGGYQPVLEPTSEIYQNNMPRQFGNLLLSKYRITQVHRHSLPWPPDESSPAGMPRGMIETVVEAPGGKLRVLTTHLEYYSAMQRMAQVKHLKYLHWEACERARLYQPNTTLDAPFQLGFRPGSAIYCGDFNFTPDSPDHAEMLATDGSIALPLVDAWTHRHPDSARAPTAGLHGFKWPDRPGCYDYFFVTDDLVPRIADVTVQSETAASDHQPIVLDIN
ncbi:MAG: endonuclease/exonuclease/phosphatase family protein [Telluria sp.]